MEEAPRSQLATFASGIAETGELTSRMNRHYPERPQPEKSYPSSVTKGPQRSSDLLAEISRR
jgi:hypothetical protein